MYNDALRIVCLMALANYCASNAKKQSYALFWQYWTNERKTVIQSIQNIIEGKQ